MAATAQLLADLGEDLARAGWDVLVLTGRGSYAPDPAYDGEMPPPRRQRRRGMDIRRVWATRFGRGSMVGRVTDYATFFLSATLAVLFGRRADVVVALSTPPLIALLGVLARLRGSRFVYKVEDLYPDVAVALGAFSRRSAAARLSGALSRWVLARSDAAVALDGAMGRSLSERGARRVVVIPNWADGEAVAPDPEAGRTFRAELGLPAGAFVVLYSGNLGLAHRFDAVVEAARRLEASGAAADGADGRPILFLFVGAGPRLEEVRSAAEGLGRVRFLPYQPRERLRALYNAADVHLITLRDAVAGLLVPSKYAASLAAGKAVLLVGGRGADLFDEIRREGLGWALGHDAEAVAEAVAEAASDPARVEEMGRRGRAVFETCYDRASSTTAWSSLLSSLLM